ncbi:MAG: exosortase/archaeosortase family protein [Victivallaceae bacterium]|nr:exosortase/archaeosortase family protein [Victivallaceae bacterium]
MKNFVLRLKQMKTADRGLILVSVLTAVYGLYEALRMHQEIESIVTLWFLAAGMSAVIVRNRIKNTAVPDPQDIILSWIFLGCAGVTLLLTAFMNVVLAMQISLLLVMGACLGRFADYRTVLKLFPAGFIFLLLLPNADYFNSLMSYPLRLICSYLTCFILKLCAVEISCDAAMLRLGTEKIAVTAACSGINQLEAMFLIGWIITMLVHQRLVCRVAHWLLLLPIVILLNSLRLTITLLLYLGFGKVAFNDDVHIILGYVMVFAVAFVFWACRSLIPFSEKPELSKEKK